MIINYESHEISVQVPTNTLKGHIQIKILTFCSNDQQTLCIKISRKRSIVLQVLHQYFRNIFVILLKINHNTLKKKEKRTMIQNESFCAYD